MGERAFSQVTDQTSNIGSLTSLHLGTNQPQILDLGVWMVYVSE